MLSTAPKKPASFGVVSRGLASFGVVSQPLGGHTLALMDDFTAAWASHIKPKLDLDVFPYLMCIGAEATLATFEARSSESARRRTTASS